MLHRTWTSSAISVRYIVYGVFTYARGANKYCLLPREYQTPDGDTSTLVSVDE